MKKRVVIYLAVIVLVVLTGVVFALRPELVAAEQTVAYILHGVEDGITTSGMDGDARRRLVWKKFSNEPLIFSGQGEFQSMEIKIEAISDCVYRDTLVIKAGLDEPVIAARVSIVDFTNASGVEVASPMPDVKLISVDGAQYRCDPYPSHADKNLCQKLGYGKDIFFGDTQRSKLALTYLRENYCKSGSF